MADIFDERRRGLEEDYFRRRDKESLNRLREALHEEAHAKGEGAVTMDCPRCDGKLHEEEYDQVHIDRCDTCHGIWLDAGEFDHLVSQESPSGRWFRVFWPGKTTE